MAVDKVKQWKWRTPGCNLPENLLHIYLEVKLWAVVLFSSGLIQKSKCRNSANERFLAFLYGFPALRRSVKPCALCTYKEKEEVVFQSIYHRAFVRDTVQWQKYKKKISYADQW